jgi:hypothetical protein
MMQAEIELNQMRADSALVVRALDCALALINGLLLFLPHGMVQPPELGGMKQQLDDAMAMIRRREGEPDLTRRLHQDAWGTYDPKQPTETITKEDLLEAGADVMLQQADEIAKLKAEVERVTHARGIACFNITELTDQKRMLTGVLTDALTLVDYMIGELRNNNVVPSAALQVAQKQFDEKMRKLLKLNRDMLNREMDCGG